jgi:hypothetical protein
MTPTRLGITPRRCSTNSLGKTIPAAVQHYAERPVSAPWHCATYFCTAKTSSPRRGTAKPSKGNKYFLYVYIGLHRDVRPTGTVFSVAISPVRPSPPLQRHCNATLGTASTSPTLLRRTGTGHRHARHCASYGLLSMAPSSQHAGSGRPSNLYATTLEAAPVRAQDPPRRPNRSRIRGDDRQLRGTARRAFTRRRIVRHACKLLSPWPIKGGAVSQPKGTDTETDDVHLHAFRLHTILALASISTSRTWRTSLLSRLACSTPLQALRCNAIQCPEHIPVGRTVPAGTRINLVSPSCLAPAIEG